MKKIFYTCIILSCLFNSYKLTAQLLQAGDAVVTMSGNVWSNNIPPPSQNFVLEILRTRNTSSFSIGTGWTPMTQANFNIFAYKDQSWTRNNLGNIFGLTIDDNRNIYATATGFFGQQVAGISTGQVWKIDRNTGVVTAFKDLHTSGQNQNSLGNIKFFNGFLYVSNLADGKIYVIDVANPNTNFTPFDPGGASDNRKPHGLAIRNVGGNSRLFFSLNDFNSSNTAIHSIGINGAIFTGLEQVELSNFTIKPMPITDIAFSSDYSRMILAEKSTSSWTSTNAHGSNILEYMSNGTNWVLPSSGYSYNLPGGSSGGLSFSKVVIKKDAEFKCDTTIWATSDFMYNYTYGITGFRHQNGQGTPTGINIDFDNDVVYQDKNFLGDVEVCDTTINCSTCSCGQWGSTPLALTIQNAAGQQTLNRACGSSQSYISGQVSGTLNANYTCAGTCSSIINWTLTNTVTNAQVAAGNLNNGSINLSQFNSLACADYKFVFTPSCGGTTCPPCEFNISIVCNPPTCCPTQTQIGIEHGNATYTSSTNPNGAGTYSQAFIINGNVPMSEIRIDVEHFEINSTDPDCISCKNPAKTWGSLNSAAFNGNGFVRPIISVPFNGSINSNPRELVYKPGSLININNSVINVNVAMPNASPVDCCVLTANLCLKFTFKDAQCRECIYLVCNQNIEIKKSENGNPNGNNLNKMNKTIQKVIF